MLRNIEKKYDIIYIDVPWSYNRKGGKKHIGTAAQTYPTLSDEEVFGLDVSSIASGDSIIFSWTTWPKIQEGIEAIKRWGFEYKTVGFIWVKTNKVSTSTIFWGSGHYTRANTEICLIGIKGKPKIYYHGVHQVVTELGEEISEQLPFTEVSPNIGHSKKPDTIRDKIVELCGDIPRIELFGRDLYVGWDYWGNEL